MAISKSNNGAFFTLTGTLDEVRAALSNEGVTISEIIAVFHNGTNYDCFYKKG